MKLSHFVIIFAIITISVIVVSDINTNNMKAVIENKEQINRNLDTAIDDGVNSLAEVDESNNIIINKEGAINSFFISLDTSFGILEDKAAQQKLNLYVPVAAVTQEDGYYVFYSDEYKGSDGYTYLTKHWSEKYPYYYEDNYFIYSFTLGDVVTIYDKNKILNVSGGTRYSMDYHDFQTDPLYQNFRNSYADCILLNNEKFQLVRKQTIINCLENTMAYYTSRHNKIAAKYGITYNFSFPAMDNNNWAANIDNVSIFVVFQGYPYGSMKGESYNRIATAAAKISKDNRYYVEQKGWYYVYHKTACPELRRSDIILLDQVFYNPDDCIALGSYACPICSKNDIYAPNYTP